MPMIPELPIAMLACARIGAPHTVVFGGFSAEALSGRINDCGAKVLITADGGYRRGKEVGAQAAMPTRRSPRHADDRGDDRRQAHSATTSTWSPAATIWWHDIVDRQSEDCPPVPVESEHMLYLLYTSGTTAKPKGILHTTGGYLVGTSFSHDAIFDIKPDDVYWCAADIGWVTGHSYIVYGPLANATTGVLYEGAPDTPAWDRWWQIIEDYKVSILYCAPDRHPRVHEAGRGAGRRSTTCRPCACSARSASRSIPKPGCGTASTSAGQGAGRRHVVADRDRPDHDHARCPA